MTAEYQKILNKLRLKHAEVIEEADNNPDKWYELFITEGPDEGTHSVESGDTFDLVAIKYVSYANKHGMDNINIDIWRDGDTPENIFCFWDVEFIYTVLKNHFTDTGEILNMKMYGFAIYPTDNSKPVFEKVYTNEGFIFVDEIAFRYFNDRICYIPNQNDNTFGQHYTRTDLLELCKDNEQEAEKLFYEFVLGTHEVRQEKTIL